MRSIGPAVTREQCPAFLRNSNGRLDFLGQHKRQREFPIVIRESCYTSRKTTWFPRHRKMKPFPATASQDKSHVRNWRSKRYLAPLMRPHKVPRHPGLPGEEHRGFPAPLPLSPTTLLISTGGSTPLLCLEGVPDLPVAPRDEAGLTTTFQTWPRGCFHIAKHPDFPVPS